MTASEIVTPRPGLQPPVSVVVIGRNEGVRLDRCLHSIRELDYPAEQIELIYVDGASTDDSCAVAERWGARVLRVPPKRATAASGRNVGWRAAQHELIHFVDGDTEMHQHWLGHAVTALADDEVFGVAGRCEELSPKASVYNFCAHHDWYRPPGRSEASGGIALFRRSVLERVNGFNERLVAGEEPEMCHRIAHLCGGSVLMLDKPMARHDIHMTKFSQYWRRCMRTGQGYAEVSRMHADMRPWRQAVRRNLIHTLAPIIAVAAGLALHSWWPVDIWAVLLLVAVVHNALRHLHRIGSVSGALIYSTHHYVSKLPMAVGQLLFWLRPGGDHSGLA